MGSRGSRPTAGAWRSSSTGHPGSLVGRVVDRRSDGHRHAALGLSTSTSTAWPGRTTKSGTPRRMNGRCSARCARVTPGGTRRTITRTPGNATLWDASPDGRLVIAHTDDRAVVVAHLPGDATDRNLSWLDASWAADLSLDGRLLLFTETGQGGGPESAAYLRGTDGSPAVRLGAGRALALSPDARWAICSSAYLPSPYLELLPTGAGEPRRLPGNGLSYTGARWLPDGKRIIVSAIEPGHRTRLYLLELGQGRPNPLTPEGVTTWVVSPDGSTIAARGPSPHDPPLPRRWHCASRTAGNDRPRDRRSAGSATACSSRGPATPSLHSERSTGWISGPAVRNPGRTSFRAIARASWRWCRFASHRTADRRPTPGTAR